MVSYILSTLINRDSRMRPNMVCGLHNLPELFVSVLFSFYRIARFIIGNKLGIPSSYSHTHYVYSIIQSPEPMLLAKNMTTFILALMLASPACCCALIGCHASDEVPVRSCCSSSSDSNEDEDAPSDEHECSCSLNKQYTEQGELSFSSPDFHFIPVPPVVFVDIDPTVSVFAIDSPLAKRPPPGPTIRILYSVFRL
jgi:hypothetical protein